ncbi:securin isoform X2 [Dunckerocampus dactyliophorus]|uniref:securin isoform X2 n=1 Tax=Dunckerocampus dactyliophorus TaxID=161453 RepID=UPI0024059130|nr:securin isoform X2 [Dunckerocampus dactyliophorus]
MAHMITERENDGLRLSHLGFKPDKSLKTPAKTMRTPLAPGRKAFGVVNTHFSTPVVKVQEKKPVKLQEAKVKLLPQKKSEEYPEIEKMIPYDPLEFEKYSVPEDLIPLGGIPLSGVGFPQGPLPSEEDLFAYLAPLPSMSPVKMPQCSGNYAELDAFLQTLEELTVPPEPDSD